MPDKYAPQMSHICHIPDYLICINWKYVNIYVYTIFELTFTNHMTKTLYTDDNANNNNTNNANDDDTAQQC